MKHVGIQQACSEDWSKMTPTEKGAFCQQCTKQVHDFTDKSNDQIKRSLLEMKNQSICMRITIGQENALNAEFEAWRERNKSNFQHLFIAALLLVFGLTLFSCEDERDRQKISDAQVAVARIIEEPKVEQAPERKTIFIEPQVIPMEVVNADPVWETVTVMQIEEAPEVVEITPENLRIHYLGGASMTPVYIDYLEETVQELELDENGVPYPTEYKAVAFPNPAVESTTLEIQFPKKGQTEINLYDLSGKLIRHIYSGEVPRGIFRNPIELFDLNPGVYLVIIQSSEFRETVRIVKN